MIVRSTRSVVCACLVALLFGAVSASAQITTGNILGSVKDSTGGVVPGATVVLISEARGTKSVPAVTNATGDFVFPNVTPDTYTVEVTMDGFRTVKRAGIKVSGGDRVTVPALTLEPGGAEETVNVTSEAPLIQASSGERSFAISTAQIENLPTHPNGFTRVHLADAWRHAGGARPSGTRLGGVSQNNIMMDGISAMDTGNNGQMLNMNVESIAEVKVLTQGYQAEYGRSSGLQITAVTKSRHEPLPRIGLRHQDQLGLEREQLGQRKNGDPKPVNKRDIYGYSIGGPIGKPGGNNKLFFFYTHEYPSDQRRDQQRQPDPLRVPTALERTGDFSQTLDNNGALFNPIRDTIRRPCSDIFGASGRRRPRQDPGEPPVTTRASRSCHRYPLPTQAQTPGHELQLRAVNAALGRGPHAAAGDPARLPAVVQAAVHGQVLRRARTRPDDARADSGLHRRLQRRIRSSPTTAFTVNYALSPTTFVEGTYGFIRNELAGGNEDGILVNDSANRLDPMPGFPLIYPNAGVSIPGKLRLRGARSDVSPAFWDGTSRSTCRRSSTGAAASAPRRRTSAIPAG